MSTNNEFEYYFMERKGDLEYPLIKVVENEKDERNYTIFMHLEFNNPIPSKPVMADFLSGAHVFLTKRIIDVIKKIDPEGVRFISTDLAYKKGKGKITSSDYTALKLDDKNYYRAMDKKKSKYTVDENDEDDYWISKVVLDEAVLAKVPLKRRLVCALHEAPGYILFHKSVADAIMALNPTGMYFQNIEEHNF